MNVQSQSVESCSLVVSEVLAELSPREGDIGIQTKLCKIIILKWIIPTNC